MAGYIEVRIGILETREGLYNICVYMSLRGSSVERVEIFGAG